MNNYKIINLDNGIPLYLYNDKSLKQIYFNYIVKYGSSGEFFNFDNNGNKYIVPCGCAHFLEHLLLERSMYGNLVEQLFEQHSFFSAETGFDSTSYSFCGIDNIYDSIKKMIMSLECPVFEKKDVKKSLFAIVEEASKQSDVGSCHNMIVNNLYKDFYYCDKSLSQIGTADSNRKITTQNLWDCYEAFYTDDRKVIVMAGNVIEDEVVDYLNSIYQNIPGHKSNLVLPKYNYAPMRSKNKTIYGKNSEDIYGLGMKIKKLDKASFLEMQMALDLFFGTVFGDVHIMRDLVNDSMIYDFINIGNYVNLVHVFSSNVPNEYINNCLEYLNERMVSESDFEALKKRFIADQIRLLNDKYYFPSNFSSRMSTTTNYCDIDDWKRFDYAKFMDILNGIDFKHYTKGAVKTK